MGLAEPVRVLGTKPALGRVFVDDIQDLRGVMISYTLWTRRYGRDQNVINRPSTFSSHDRPGETETYTILGVLPQGFWFLRNQFEMWLPLAPEPEAVTNRESRTSEWVPDVGDDDADAAALPAGEAARVQVRW